MALASEKSVDEFSAIRGLRSHERHHRNRLLTRAQQDAAWLVRRKGVRLVATEPNIMVQRLLGHLQDVEASGISASAETPLKKARKRLLRRRLHETGFAARLNHIKRLTDAAGILYLQPDYRRTTQDCSWCGTRVPKELWQRRHQCYACGADADRDHNAARNILARALRQFITSPDPDGLIEAILLKQQEKLAKQQSSYDRRQAGLRKRWETYRQNKQVQNGDVVIPAAKSLEMSG